MLPSSTPWSLALMSTYLHFLGVETGLSFHYPPVWAPPNGKSLYNLSERERSEQTEVHGGGGGGWWWGGGQLKLLLCRCHSLEGYLRRSSRFTASPMSVTGGCRVSLDGRCISPLLFSIFWILSLITVTLTLLILNNNIKQQHPLLFITTYISTSVFLHACGSTSFCHVLLKEIRDWGRVGK